MNVDQRSSVAIHVVVMPLAQITIRRDATKCHRLTLRRAGIGVRTTDPIDIKDPAVLREMVVSIIIHENGGNPYAPAVIDESVRRALA